MEEKPRIRIVRVGKHEGFVMPGDEPVPLHDYAKPIEDQDDTRIRTAVVSPLYIIGDGNVEALRDKFGVGMMEAGVAWEASGHDMAIAERYCKDKVPQLKKAANKVYADWRGLAE